MAIEPQPELYTSREEVASILSAQGIDLRIDDNDDGEVTDGTLNTLDEVAYLTDAIEEATDEINRYAQHFYTEEALATSRWVRRRASYLAAHILGRRRGNPSVYCDEVEKIEKELQQIQNGLLNVPRLAKRDDFAPSLSNLVVDRNYSKSKLRVEQQTRTGPNDPQQDADWLTGHGYY